MNDVCGTVGHTEKMDNSTCGVGKEQERGGGGPLVSLLDL